MEYRPSGTYESQYAMYEYRKHQPYDYEHKGLLVKLMPRSIVNTKNEYTKAILKMVEFVLVWLMKYVDILKNFKDPNYKQY